MKQASHPDLNDAVAAKRKFPVIDRLVLDRQLDQHLFDFGGLAPDSETLTLGRALLLEERCPDFLSVARSLEFQLQSLASRTYRNRIKTQVKHLLNGDLQFLNTVSEFALALRLQADGWGVELAHVFDDTGKDVDVLAVKGGDARFVEVINLAPEPMSDSLDGFMPMPGSGPLNPKLLAKVVDKYKTKFKAAIDAGWKGKAWVALDYAKMHDLSVDLLFRRALTAQDWPRLLAAEAGRRCPALGGVIYYWSTATHPYSSPIEWCAC